MTPEERAMKWCDDQDVYLDREIRDSLVQAFKSAVAAELEACAKAMCHYCAAGQQPFREKVESYAGGIFDRPANPPTRLAWCHIDPDDQGLSYCDAADIWARAHISAPSSTSASSSS